MTAIFDKIPGWGWAIITLILAVTLAVHIMVNPIVFGRMICQERACGKIRVVTNEGGHEFYSESVGSRGFFVVPIMNRLKKSHAVHLFLMERIGDKETEISLGGPISISFANVIAQNEVELTVNGYNITKVEYAGGNVFTLVVPLFDEATESASTAVATTLAWLRDAFSVSEAHAGDITDLPGFLGVQRSVNSANDAPMPVPQDVLIGQSAPPADPATAEAIRQAIQSAQTAQQANNLPLSADANLRVQVEQETGFAIPDSHWQDIESPSGLSTYLNARAVLAKKHPDLFAPDAGMSWGEAASKADGQYGEKYIFLPESTVNSLAVR